MSRPLSLHFSRLGDHCYSGWLWADVDGFAVNIANVEKIKQLAIKYHNDFHDGEQQLRLSDYDDRVCSKILGTHIAEVLLERQSQRGHTCEADSVFVDRISAMPDSLHTHIGTQSWSQLKGVMYMALGEAYGVGANSAR